ncbi:MAG: long-chain fatty acid--CoA ligase [Candidatus Obscuribacterales bacterium]|nr:long-chain fatty acid--CoA ligase [Candidatus Obscuribacterales bacterium]
MLSTMMQVPLTIGTIIEHASRCYPTQKIVSVSSSGRFEYTIAEFAARVAKLANALTKMGIKPGDRVASFAWNSHRHLELYYAVPMAGAVLHTVNIRLFAAQIAYVLKHADDKAIFFDSSLSAVLKPALAEADFSKLRLIVMGDAQDIIVGAADYEELIKSESDKFDSPVKDENEAAMLCYTSATTGEPKGVLYSHRSTVLHAMAAALPDVMGMRNYDTVLPVVPMFHVNAWGYPFACMLIGARQVYAGDIFDAARLIKIFDDEEVTMTGGVPTIWMRIRDELKRTGARFKTLNHVLVGGSALSASLMRDLDALGLEVTQGYGMTETSPLVSISRNSLTAALQNESPEKKMQQRLKQGMVSFGVQWRVVGDSGEEVVHDGKTFGELQFRGPWITAGYYNDEDASRRALTVDGWMHTGDICTVDQYSYLQIVDRVKDVVKSGGEWISSVDLENSIMAHPHVREAAVIGLPHPDWVERPVAVVALRADIQLSEEQLKEWLRTRVAKWWLPDRVIFLEAIPQTGVGKFLKRELRERYHDLLS